MNKKKLDCNKQLVRNHEDYLPKRVVVQQLPQPEEITSKTTTTQQTPTQEPQADFLNPVLNSALCVEKRMKQLEQVEPKKIKSASELTNRRTFDEKVTKQMNYPFDKKLYKELISLKLIERPVVQTGTVVHEPILRDKIPKLNEFFKPKSNYEYRIPVPSSIGPQSTSQNYNGLRLSKVINTWKNDRPD